MTPCTKPVTRLSAVHVRDGGKPRAIVVTLHAGFLELRLHGTRRTETIDLSAAYFGAVKARVFRDQMVKAKERKAKAAVARKR
jgi:hypothetical protein